MTNGIQIAALAVTLTILINYFQTRRMPLMSTRLFTIFLSMAFFNILAEIATLYTIYHIDTVSPWINRFCHQLFIGSLDCMAFCLYLYVDVKMRRQRRYRPGQLFIRSIPVLLSLVMVLFGRLDYYLGEDGRYSYGPMAMTVYASVAVYLIMALRQIMRSRESFSRKEKRNLLLGFTAWVVIAVLQFWKPTMLMSSLGVVVMVQFVYIAFENPREYLEHGMENVLNEYAYLLMLSELLERKSSFYICSLNLTNEEAIAHAYGYQQSLEALQRAADYLGRQAGTAIYRPWDSTVSVLLEKEEMESLKEAWLQERDSWEQPGRRVVPKYFLSILECPRYGKTIEDITGFGEFISSEGRKDAGEPVITADEALMERKNYVDTVERILQDALRDDGLEVYYQPIYSSQKKRFVSAEALVRLKDRETLGFISPEFFIPLAEERGMISQLGEMVFRKVCAFSSSRCLWERGLEYIEVNISGIQSVDKKLPDMLDACMKQYEVPPGFINLEITETASIEAGERLVENMDRLRALGCRFSMDDFGTGYSNLAQIAQTRFELIKFDKSLIWPCFGENGEDAAVVLEACIDMVHKLQVPIVAEGVETLEQAQFLIGRGVEYLQGYYYARPVPEAEFLRILEADAPH